MELGWRKARVLSEPSLWSRLVSSVAFAAPRFSPSGLGLLFLGRKAHGYPSEGAVLPLPMSWDTGGRILLCGNNGQRAEIQPVLKQALYNSITNIGLRTI